MQFLTISLDGDEGWALIWSTMAPMKWTFSTIRVPPTKKMPLSVFPPIVKFFNVTTAPLFIVSPSMLPAVPAQSMVRDLLTVAPVTTSLLSAQESTTGGVAVARLIASESKHGADCEHVVPEPFPAKNRSAA